MPEERPKILLMAPDLPYPIRAGGQMRMASFVEALSRCAQVHVACLRERLPDETIAWGQDLGITIAAAPRQKLTGRQIWGNRIRNAICGCNLGFHPGEMEFFNRQKKDFAPDLAWLETPYLVRYAMAWRGSLPIIVNYWGTSEGAERDFRHARGLKRIWEWLRWRAALGGEARYAPLLSGIVTVSELDAGHFRRLAPAVPVTAIPNGIPPLAKDYSGVTQRAQQLLLTGDLAYRPNVDAAVWFVREILPLIRAEEPAVCLKLVGRNPAPAVQALAAPGIVEIAGFVPDLHEPIAESAVYVLPMRLGSGIRSKLFDVFPLGKAIVSTGIGAEGLELRDRENCLIADTPAAFAAACVELLRSPQLATKLGAAAQRLATEVYSQDNINRQVRKLIEKSLLQPAC